MNSKDSSNHSENFRAILIQKIPTEINEIPILMNHFQKYGHIDSIRIKGNQAVVIFQNQISAIHVLRSSKALKRNRFIEISLIGNCEKSDLEHLCSMKLIRELNTDILKVIQKEKEKTQRLQEDLKKKQSRINIFSQLENDIVKIKKSMCNATEEEKVTLSKKLNDLMEMMKDFNND